MADQILPFTLVPEAVIKSPSKIDYSFTDRIDCAENRRKLSFRKFTLGDSSEAG
jgi:hypothetical protein